MLRIKEQLYLEDDSSPQNTEVDEYMTLSITPKSANRYYKSLKVINVF